LTTSGRGSNVFRNLLQHAEEVEVNRDDIDSMNSLLSALKVTDTKFKETRDQDQPQKKTKSTTGKEMIDNFWKGKQCLKGGAGWWKYEFCYGRVVKQYHEEAGKPKTEIVLGMFNENLHRAWADINPHKAKKVGGDGRVYQISNLYTHGDTCSETGAHRSCEVRMRCSTSSDHFDIGRVLIYLIEPETCSYVLVLESGLFCDGLQEVDGYGLMEKMPALEASEIEHESREVSASESPSFSMSYTDAERQMEGSEPQQQQPEEGEAQRKSEDCENR